jgi:hypothetical protein
MRKKALLPMVLLLATAGCACIRGVEPPVVRGQHQPAETRRAHFCRDRECVVTVEVDKDCVVKVDPYYLVMAGKGEMKIVWTIRGGTFARDPIRWKQAAAAEVFTFSRERSSPAQVAFTNNRKIGVFNYGVTVMRGDKTCAELDPTGINDMP